jgi:hypothetical protein
VPFSAPTVAALTAILVSSLADGDFAFVHSYAGNAIGGGLFVWDATSTAATDGGITFVPDELTAAATQQILTYGSLSNANGALSLAHSGIVWGSVGLGINNGAQSLGSQWFHGHSIFPRHTTGGNLVGRDAPILDHAAGSLWGDSWFRVRNCIWSNTNTNATVNLRTAPLDYRYTTGAGRWIRQVGGYVTPAMFGGNPANPSFDNSFAIGWALNWLNGQSKVKTLKFDGNYYVKGMCGEIYSGITLKGLGKELPCWTYFGDQGGGVGGIADFLKTAYLAHTGEIGPTDPYFLMGLHSPVLIQFDNATGFEFEDFNLDGNVANNLYFLVNAGGAWDVTPVSGAVSQVLRESPNCGGFFVSTQDGRALAAGTRWGMHRTQIANTLGSCVAYANGGAMDYSDVRFGNSLSGRVFYGGQGKGRGLTLFGYSRTSYWSPYSGHLSDVTWELLTANPWPANALDPALMAYRSEDYIGEANDLRYDSVTQERYAERHLKLDGFAAIVSNATRYFINLQGERLDLTSGSIYGPTSGLFTILNTQSQGFEGGMSGPSCRGLRSLNRSS